MKLQLKLFFWLKTDYWVHTDLLNVHLSRCICNTSACWTLVILSVSYKLIALLPLYVCYMLAQFPIILLFSPFLFLPSFLSRLPPASPCAATHLGGVLLSDNGSGRARSSYPPPVILKWDLDCARAEEVITDQGGLVLKRSWTGPRYD